ncbi:MAG: hypothetical protein IPG38_19090 [Chitinophagaceae bacterium]|nr:hypothetical protein [Chitinophagaceae bacterium]
MVLAEEQQNNSFTEALAGRISKACFQYLDAPVEVMGALNLPAVPMNIVLENAMLPNAEKDSKAVGYFTECLMGYFPRFLFFFSLRKLSS